MAIAAAFKQQCPSCEALVPVKDAGMIGKKIDCPKCKYRFVVEAPAEKEETDEAAEDVKARTKPEAAAPRVGDKTKQAIQDKAKAKVNGKAAKEAVTTKANGKAAAAKTKPDSAKLPAPAGSGDAESSAAESGGTPEAAKKEASKKKLMLGLVLAGVGVAVLAVAAFVILGKSSNTGKSGGVVGGGTGGFGNKGQLAQDDGKGAHEKKDGNDPPVKTVEQKPPEPQLGAAGPDFTNLVPNDCHHLLHVYFKNAFHAASPILDVTFPRNNTFAFSKEEFQQRLGFPVLAIDDLLRAENFTTPWTFTIAHTTRAVEEKELVRALDLEAVKPPIAGQTYYVAKQRLAWLEELGQLSLGAAEYPRALRERQKERPLYVCLHNPQIIIFADAQPLTTFLGNGGRFKYRTELPAPPNDAAPKQPGTPQPGKLPPGFAPGVQQSRVGLPSLENFQAAQQLQDSPAQTPPGGSTTPPGGETKPGLPMPPEAKQKVPPAPDMPAPPPVVPGDALGANTYMTINRTMKNVLDRLETRPAGSKDKVFFSAVTDMNAARLVTKDPDFQDHLLWHFRQLWDVTQLIQEKKARVHYLGVSLHQKGSKLYRYKSELVCSETNQAKDIAKDLVEQGAPRVLKFFDRLFGHGIELIVGVEPDKRAAKEQQPGGMMKPGFPGGGFPGGAMPGMPGGAMPGMPGGGMPGGGFPGGGAGMPGSGGGFPGSGGGMPGSGGGFPGSGGGFPGMPGGGFPGSGGFKPPRPPGADGMNPNVPGVPGVPGNQPRPSAPSDDDELMNSRLTINVREERVEFTLDLLLDQNAYGYMYEMARLFVQGLRSQVDLAEAKSYRHKLATAAKNLGVDGLSSRGVPPGFYPPGAFKRPAMYRSGRDPSQRVSWMAGLLPFLGRQDVYNFVNFDHSWRDPSNWLAGRMLVPEFLDPTYPIGSRRVMHPELPFELATTHYVGIAGIGLDAADYPPNDPAFDFKRGILGYESSRGLKEVEHGLSNTILMMQVPHNGPAGVTPWIAGGGSTLRGVPEKNSVAPFVSTEYNGKRGTYAVMADGSVRFISAKISDEALKALCTAKGPVPENSALNDWAPEVPAPVVPKKEQEKAGPPTSTKESTKEQPKKTAPPSKEEKKAASVETKQLSPAIRENQLKMLGLAYRNVVDATKKPPAKMEELALYLEKDVKITDALKQGLYVVIWKSTFEAMKAGTANTILGYEKDAPTNGGLVLMADGSVRTMTADEFKKAPRATGS